MENHRTSFTLPLIALLLIGVAGCTDSTTEPGSGFNEPKNRNGHVLIDVGQASTAPEVCEACEECTVTPTTHADLGSGTVDAKRVGDYQYTSGKLDGDRRRGGTVGPITWTTDPTGTYVSWSVSGPHGGIAIVMKGGPRANVYVYEDDCRFGTQLACPPNSSGGPAQLSNITFYWNECPDDC